ncbi:hypothetical protein FE392_15460 [Xenorhabdus sp. 12]|uniref:Uncharacterized protein n=1 Tax=Xenorhabdus santafensis TaxID=2582833 RepID=A0ABU4SD44_9GAMM|nr:hypothetical protein [Xenorhabdus sp. 12]MDX7988708.1 hypothetical protein [Xenorhabdus sp. 12]
MEMKDILQETLQATQSTFTGGSFNVDYYDSDILPIEKRPLYTEEAMSEKFNKFDALYKRVLEPSGPLIHKDVYRYLNENKNKNLVGNCMLYSMFAFYHLAEIHKNSLVDLFYHQGIDYTEYKSLLTIQVACLQAPYSHAFVMICPPSKIDARTRVFTTFAPNIYPENTWICDPWADIACRAVDYNDKWKIKMAQSNYEGKMFLLYSSKEVYENTGSTRGCNSSPLGKYNYSSIQMGTKSISDIITLFPDGHFEINR